MLLLVELGRWSVQEEEYDGDDDDGGDGVLMFRCSDGAAGVVPSGLLWIRIVACLEDGHFILPQIAIGLGKADGPLSKHFRNAGCTFVGSL